jgi:TetR/AcrR family transcriptional regulator, transcriptional repressor for nem operon
MRRSRSEAARARRDIVAAASRLFRACGISSVRIADTTGSLRLRDGAFYRHFPSKAALVVEALESLSVETVAANMERLRHLGSRKRAATLIDIYLSNVHRAYPEIGCPVSALCSGMRHASPKARAAFTVALQRIVAAVDGVLVSSVGQRRAGVSVAEFVGAVVLSRATDDDALAGEILEVVSADAKNTPV